MFHEYDVVKLKKNIPLDNPPIRTKGTILLVYHRSPGSPAYEVEFTNDEGITLALLTVNEDDIEKVSPYELNDSRNLSWWCCCGGAN